MSPPPDTPVRRLEVVGIAASAADLGALQAFFARLPHRSGLAYVVALDAADGKERGLVEALRRRTGFPVVPVTRGHALEPDRIYLIPSDGAVFSRARLDPLKRPLAEGDGAPADLLFRTLAETHREAAAGVLLSRPSEDGGLGLQRIKECGGLTLVQDPEEAEYAETARAAVQNGFVDRVLPAAELGPELLRLRRERFPSDGQADRAGIDQMARANADLENLIDSTDVATLFLDPGLAVRRFTPRVVDVFDLGPEDIGRHVSEVEHGMDYDELASDAFRVVADAAKIEREVPAQDGRRLLVRMSPYRSLDDRAAGVVITLIDTTELGRARREREVNEAKTNFLAVLSHEFRTPLSSIVGYTALLAEGIAGDLTERQHHHVSRIREAARQLEEMIDEILAYSDQQVPGRGPRPTAIDPAKLARTVVELGTPTARSKGLEMRIELDDHLTEIRADPMKLRQILLHLLGNAVKFTDAGHVLLRVQPNGAGVLFEVEDTGVGIRPEDLEHVFEPFWQEDMGRTRTHGGIGLGLSVVRDLAHLLGGSVAVESEPGRGTRFSVSLPSDPPPRTSETNLDSEVPNQGPTAG